MRVILAERVLDGIVSELSHEEPVLESNVWKLHKLFGYVCERRHVLAFDPPSALSRCLELFDSRTRAAYARAMDLSARATATRPANAATIRIEADSVPRWDDPVAVLPLDNALAVLREPLGILLENADNDWFFLLGLMRPSERGRLSDAVTQGWAEPLHGGGGTLPRRLTTRCAVLQKGLRTFALFDSDRRHPDELDVNWKPQNQENCQGYLAEEAARAALPGRYWMLKRRFIESYMPRAELLQGASPATHPDAVDAFFRMTRDERWYFNMKHGFHGDEPRENKHRRGALYATVSPDDQKALHAGFGRQLADHYSLAPTREFDWDLDARDEAAEALPRLMRLL